MDIIIHFFRSYPEMAIFLTLGIGFGSAGNGLPLSCVVSCIFYFVSEQ